MSSRVGESGGSGLFDVGVIVCDLSSLQKKGSSSTAISVESDTNLDVEFTGRHGLRIVKFVPPNRGFAGRFDVCGLCRRGIGRSGREIPGAFRLPNYVVLRDLICLGTDAALPNVTTIWPSHIPSWLRS